MGIDHGTKRIGAAVGSAGEAIATPLAVIPARPCAEVMEHIQRLAADYAVEGIVVGLPVNMNGTEGMQAGLARKMASDLAKATGLDVRLWDERLSSFAADKALAGTLTRRKRAARQDAVAAAQMLTDFLERCGPEQAPRALDDANS